MIIASSNTNAYNQIQSLCEKGYRYYIQKGEFENDEFTHRMQAMPLHCVIENPLNFCDLPDTITLQMIEQYYAEFWNSIKLPTSDYTYGERMAIQLPAVFDMLKETPRTNQAVISIAKPEDLFLKHKPCMRTIQFMIYDDIKTLNIISHWRSNDAKEAFLYNQGAISLLLKDAAEYAGLAVGRHDYFSAGTHVYSHSKI